LKIEPTSKVRVEYEDSMLVKLAKVEEEDYITPPPLSILHINVQTLSGKIKPEDPLVLIKSKYKDISNSQQAVETFFDSEEERDIFEAFCSYVQDKNPDILVFEGDHYASTILDYLFARMVKVGLELSLGREN
jgi:DNA polymerase elongation subunit (family B)